MRKRSDRLACIAVAGLILVLALGGLVYALSASPYPDEIQYWQIGRNLLRTGVYSIYAGTPTAFRTPGAPMALAMAQAIGLDFTASRVLVALLLLPLGAWLAWRWLTSIGVSRKASACAVAAAFANPALVASSGTLYPQFGVAVAYLAAIAAWSESERTNATGSRLLFALAAGLSLGVSVMLVSANAVVIAAMFAWALWRVRRRSVHGEARPRTQIAAIAAVAVGVCLVVTPWFVRNAIVFGRFPLMGTNGGVTLLYGNTSATRVDSGPDLKLAAADQPPAGSSELDTDEFYRERALEHIRQQPLYYAGLYVEKVAYGVWPSAVTLTQGSNSLGDVAQRFYYGLLYLGLLAWLLLKRRFLIALPWIADVGPYLTLAVLMATASVLSYAVFFTRLRYRLPADVPLGLFAGLGVFLLLSEWSKRLQDRRRERLKP